MFIYPGSISRVKDRIVKELERKFVPGTTTFREVFAGSAVAGIELARRHASLKIELNDLDPYMYAFWNLVAKGSKEQDTKFKQLISQCPSLRTFNSMRKLQTNITTLNMVDRAHHAVVFHRCTYSGIFFGSVRGGVDQAGGRVNERYNGNCLVSTYDDLVRLLRGRLTASNMNASVYIKKHAGRGEDVWFFDPPWFERGAGWYAVSMADAAHVQLAKLLHNSKLKQWVMIIGEHPRVRQLYHHGFRIRTVKVYRTAGRAKSVHTDLLIDS